MQQEPALTEDGFAILTGKYGGKLVAQSCLTPMVHTAIGGPGREFWVNDRNYPLVRSYVEGTALESGWGRVEMTPAAPRPHPPPADPDVCRRHCRFPGEGRGDRNGAAGRRGHF